MTHYPSRRTRRNLTWARRPSLSERILGQLPLHAANDPIPAMEATLAAGIGDAEPDARVIANDVYSDEEPPFDPPDADDEIFLGPPPHDEAVDETEDEFVRAPCPAVAPQAPSPLRPTIEAGVEDIGEPKPAPHAAAEAAQPDLFAAFSARPSEDEQPELFSAQAQTAPASVAPPFDESAKSYDETLTCSGAAGDEEPPFDAPDETDDVFGPTFTRLQSFAAAPAEAPPPEPNAPAIAHNGECPAPPIHIHAAWDRPEIGRLLECLAGDHRLARADIEIARGGIDSAAVRFAGQESPNLLILDTTLRRAEMLVSLDRLAHVIDHDCRIIILGSINDIGLLRELASRGVSEYIVPPLKSEDLARAVCRLYAQNDQSRVIAVVGARGGVGASTIAHNLAWSIAERQDACAALIDLDLAFGTAAFSLGKSSAASVADALTARENITDETLARAATQHTKHLQILTAPATLERTFELDPYAVDRLIHHARRANPHVVLDLPHAWNAWVKHALASADDVVLVAGPDLASLRNTKSMLEAMAQLRAGKSAPLVTLSMVGVPKRPEINAKDFTEAVGVSPVASFAFDPLLHGVCETNNQMIGEADPESKTAIALDALAATLTGRKPHARKRAADTAILARDAAADFAKSPRRGQRDPAPGANDNVLVLTRETSIGTLAASFSNDAESAYIAKARSAAQAELEAVTQTRPRKAGWVRAGIAAAAGGLALSAAAWRAEPQSDALAPAPAAAAVAPAPSSQYASALLLLGDGRASEGVALLQSAAQAGFAPAQHHLATLYQTGEVLAVDAALARAWTERAAANGNVRAMHDLGAYYTQSKDAAAAFRWFRQAAEFGLADSQYNLGVLYHDGAGVSIDVGEALFWFYVAAAGGDEEAAARAADLRARAAPGLGEQAEARARAFRPRAPNPAANAAR